MTNKIPNDVKKYR